MEKAISEDIVFIRLTTIKSLAEYIIENCDDENKIDKHAHLDNKFYAQIIIEHIKVTLGENT